MVLKLLAVLLVSLSAGRAQRSGQEAFMEYFQRRILQLEDRLVRCGQDLQNINQKMYDMSSEMRGQLRSVNVLKAEIHSFVESLATRVERVERDVEYLQDKVPDSSGLEIEEALLEEQVKEAQTKKKAMITQGKECSTELTGIKSQKIVKKSGDTIGSWLKDPSKDSSNIYFFSGSRNNTLLQFPSLKSFTDSNSSRQALTVQLPRPWKGTGHAVYEGFLYYHNADTQNEVLKVHLLNRTISDRMLLPGAGRMPVYELSPHTFLDFAVDEIGLWVIHADLDFAGNLVITKLDSSSLAVEHTWDTSCKSHKAEGAFMVCGTLYVLYNTHSGGRSSIQCLYDVHDTVLYADSGMTFFPKRYASHSSIHYHPQEGQVYAWDDGYQTIYKLNLKRKLHVN